MQLAVNYSPQAAKLLDAGAIAFDLYKCPDWPEMIATARIQRPVYVHFPLMAGRSNIDEIGWDTISHLLADTGTRLVNTHLAPRAADFGVALDSTDVNDADALIRAMLADIQPLARRFGRERVILENANWDPNYDIPRLVLDADTICHVVAESGCGFLLDLAHARMAAAYLGLDVRDYIASLPVDRLRELHITGTRYDDSEARLVDHFPMTDPDWELAAWAFEQLHQGEWRKPDIVALEYGGTGPAFGWRSDADVLAADVPRLLELVKSIVQGRV